MPQRVDPACALTRPAIGGAGMLRRHRHPDTHCDGLHEFLSLAATSDRSISTHRSLCAIRKKVILMASFTRSKLMVGRHTDQPMPGLVVGVLDARITEALGAARAAWPTVELSPEQFVGHLARHLPEGL